jgi:GNAT superfamily N-acetyltransferase
MTSKRASVRRRESASPLEGMAERIGQFPSELLCGKCIRMTQGQPSAILLRPGSASDFNFAAVVYFRAMSETLQRTVGSNPESHAALLLALWDLGGIRIIVAAGREIGWIQVAPAEAAVFVRHFCIDPDYQRLGIGSLILRHVIDEAWKCGEAVTLGVVKGSPARRFYERLGFRATHADLHHNYMRRDAAPSSAPANHAGQDFESA